MKNHKLAFLAPLLLTLTACNPGTQLTTIPKAEKFPQVSQKKMQAAQHWEVLATDVATRVNSGLQPMGGRKLYLGPAEYSPFGRTFHDLLLTKLVEQDIPVTINPRGALHMRFDTRVVQHHDRGFQPVPGLWTALGASAWVVRGLIEGSTAVQAVSTIAATAGADALSYHWNEHEPQPDTEIVVSTTVMDGTDYLLRTSDIYYINDPDVDHYVNTPPAAPVMTKKMKVVSQ